ncbi:MAG: 4Fe-4S dicluster domain-containing protein [Chloroflexota bacterium]
MVTRRQFLETAGLVLGGGLLSWLGCMQKDNSPAFLRPPGARPEPDFLAACIRCGQCVEACPYDSLRLSDVGHLAAAGTPYLTPRQNPCYLCQGYDDLKCITSCPSAALQPVAHLLDIRMGVAIIEPETCLAWQGTTCRACWHACPFPDEAIVLDDESGRPVVTEKCVGCGLCEHACLTDPSSIIVQPLALARPVIAAGCLPVETI